MIPTIFIETKGAKELQSALTRLTDLFSDFKPLFEKLGEKFFPMVRGKFDAGGPGWAPLTSATEARKAKLYGGPSRILVATKELYNSFAVGGPGSIERIRAQEAEFGSSDFKGFLHQVGAGRLPERKIIDVTEQQENQLAKEADDYLVEKIRALGFEVA